MFRFNIQSATLLIGLLLLAWPSAELLSRQSGQAVQTQKSESAQVAPYEFLAKGIVSSAPFRVQFKSAPLRLEIRNLVMGRGETESIPTPSRILLEVRQGAVTASVNQEKRSFNQGDFWAVEKGNSFTIQNSGEVAVLRAIYIFEGSR